MPSLLTITEFVRDAIQGLPTVQSHGDVLVAVDYEHKVGESFKMHLAKARGFAISVGRNGSRSQSEKSRNGLVVETSLQVLFVYKPILRKSKEDAGAAEIEAVIAEACNTLNGLEVPGINPTNCNFRLQFQNIRPLADPRFIMDVATFSITHTL
ncbi:MAG: hypothetical protein ACQKBY_06045 [Verrucomicrobiales bacterium]